MQKKKLKKRIQIENATAFKFVRLQTNLDILQ